MYQTLFEKYLIEEIGIAVTRVKEIEEAIIKLHNALCKLDTDNLSKVHNMTFEGLMRAFIALEGVKDVMPKPKVIENKKSSYGWVITKDFFFQQVEGTKSSVGIMGPSNVSKDIIKRLNNGEGIKFRLYDDDGALYVEGLQITNGDEESEFAPLDDYGTPNLGCTELKQYIDGKWVIL